MRSFFKGLFKKKAPRAEISEEKVTANDLAGWVNGKESEIKDRAENKIKYFRAEIETIKGSITSAVGSLLNASLPNPNISEKEKHFMEGNRDAYARRVNILLKKTNIPDGPIEAIEAAGSFDKELEDFGKSTYRTFRILQEFLANETRDISICIKNLDLKMKELKSELKKTGILDVKHVKDCVSELNKSIYTKKELSGEIDDLRVRKKKLNAAVRHAEDETGRLKMSEGYQRYLSLKKDERQALLEMKTHSDILSHSFSGIESALKKYSRISVEHEKTAEEYLKGPLSALFNDGDLKIVRCLTDMEKNIGSLQLKEKKMEKTLREMRKLDRDFFNRFKIEHVELKEKLSKVISDISSISAPHEVGKIEMSRKLMEEDARSIEKDIKEKEDELSKIIVQSKLKDVETAAMQAFSVRLKIDLQ